MADVYYDIKCLVFSIHRNTKERNYHPHSKDGELDCQVQ